MFTVQKPNGPRKSVGFQKIYDQENREFWGNTIEINPVSSIREYQAGLESHCRLVRHLHNIGKNIRSCRIEPHTSRI